MKTANIDTAAMLTLKITELNCCVVMCCYVLLCVVMCCYVLLCVVMCCYVLLCVVMCCQITIEQL